MGQTIRLGIDVACRADHQASCADAAGEFLWSGWRFRTTTSDLERLWAKVSGLEHQHKGITKAGDPGLRESLFMAADLARKVYPALAERYHRLVVAEGRHHNSANCAIAAVLVTRIAACWRRGEHYVLRDVDGREITESEGRKICTQRYKVSAEERSARRRFAKAQQFKRRAGRGRKESTEAAPASNPPAPNAIRAAVA